MRDRKEARDAEFQSFVVGRWPRLLRTAFLLTGEQHAAEDLVQSTLERAYAAWRRVGAADDPDAYVRRVMINAHARRHRSASRSSWRRRTTRAYPRAARRRRPHRAGGRPRRAADGARRTALRQREAVVLRYWEDLSEAQAAEAMSCSVGTVKSNAAQGIAKLRALPGLAEALTTGGRK